jgi:hypothetical protein
MKERRKQITTAVIIQALKALDGKVYIAAERLGCHPDTIYYRAKRIKAVQDAITLPRNQLVDMAETALKQAVLKGEAWAVCFALKCQGKDRGYVERQEVTGKDGGPIQQKVDVNALTDDARLARLNALLDAARTRRDRPSVNGAGERPQGVSR